MSTAFFETTEAPVNPATYGDIPVINSTLFTLFGTHDGSDFPEEFLVPLDADTQYFVEVAGRIAGGGTAPSGFASFSLVRVDQSFDWSVSANDQSLLIDPIQHNNVVDAGSGTSIVSSYWGGRFLTTGS